mmetsp:Transcript_16838/g.28645  ORF Transcript_16838/g.28645 Transcript_16838/m.28645 type:complete len:218 (+) Transcript_16838:1082-1735(+)
MGGGLLAPLRTRQAARPLLGLHRPAAEGPRLPCLLSPRLRRVHARRRRPHRLARVHRVAAEHRLRPRHPGEPLPRLLLGGAPLIFGRGLPLDLLRPGRGRLHPHGDATRLLSHRLPPPTAVSSPTPRPPPEMRATRRPTRLRPHRRKLPRARTNARHGPCATPPDRRESAYPDTTPTHPYSHGPLAPRAVALPPPAAPLETHDVDGFDVRSTKVMSR